MAATTAEVITATGIFCIAMKYVPVNIKTLHEYRLQALPSCRRNTRNSIHLSHLVVAICFLTAAEDAYYEISKKKHLSINENCVIHKPVDNESLLMQIKSIL
jgi:hypothetical protein